MAQPPTHPDRILLKVGTPASKSEKDLIYANILIKRYQTEKIHGKVILIFKGGDMVHATEERTHIVPNTEPPRENGV